MDLVNAQQARRALDYLVGFNLSPVLWRKVQRGLSAGRVQSPALRMIVEREEEIEAFKAREYWSIEADLRASDQRFKARLLKAARQEVRAVRPDQRNRCARGARARWKAAARPLVVSDVRSKERKRRPSPPFTTSTLQQEAARKLGFHHQPHDAPCAAAVRRRRARRRGHRRPDHLHAYRLGDLSDDAISELREVIARDFGPRRCRKRRSSIKNKSKNAQEAHEAIRPTSAHAHAAEVAAYLNDDQRKLYELIWKRAVASQMIRHAQYRFGRSRLPAAIARSAPAARRSSIPGFLAVYEEGRDQKNADDDDEAQAAGHEDRRSRAAGSTSSPTSISPSRRRAIPKRAWSRRWRNTASAGRRPTPASSRSCSTANT